MAGKTIQAAGGIVMRNRARTQFAIVQRAKDELWVLPRGKLKRDESALAGARREVVEETGHRVRVCEFVGAITYRARGRAAVRCPAGRTGRDWWHWSASRSAANRCPATACTWTK